MGIFGLVVSKVLILNKGLADNATAGITNGQEMVAHYIKQRWPGALSDTVISMADVAGRGQEYDTGKGSDTAWWLWIFMRAIARSPLSLFRKPIGSS